MTTNAVTKQFNEVILAVANLCHENEMLKHLLIEDNGPAWKTHLNSALKHDLPRKRVHLVFEPLLQLPASSPEEVEALVAGLLEALAKQGKESEQRLKKQ